ncbi:homocysteine S-methyltransferase family protein [Flavobacterium sp. HSC-61S13]|uniref:homocysteine S-methyltransferase family protein n=1 Tax=Flavobacterium sp. HSC-61S13 TaxID=2910963 RepID=UPI00209F93D3|nr:homocysteine S-methyltransferase family protein [Flavobacterium sp. HSC-61S13]MCP1995263.1 5-methyltetrahydrofolate--homocysteine methyltransferase [Flavobacterium sp. HSC-61S13]
MGNERLNRYEQLYKALESRILILDGAMGTMIQKHHFSEVDYRGDRFREFEYPLQGNNDLLSLTQPEAVLHIHQQYLEVGADIIETNTFSSTTIGMADYHMEDLVYELNFESARIARTAADQYTAKTPLKPRFVAGAIGPTNRTASMSPDVNDPGYRAVSFDDLRLAYKQQADGLLDGGCDIFLVETIFDTLNAKAALFALEEVKEERGVDVPIMVSGTITDASGRTLSGQTVEAFLISISHIPLLSIGLNCALGADQLNPYLKTLARNTPLAISAYPNAGLPNAFGQYDETPEEMEALVRAYFEDGLVNIVGGCCGTTPDHIRLIAETALQFKPRKLTLSLL